MLRSLGLPFTVLCLLFSFLSLLSGGCARRESTVARGNREGVLHMSIGAEPSDLDPQTVTGTNDAKIIHSLFEALVSYEPGTLAPLPALAERWETSADGLTYTFHLRADARWSNGDPLTAQDCVDAWRRILTPTLGADYAYFLYLIRGGEAFHKGKTTDFSTVGAVARDPRTLVVTITHPAPYFLQILLNSPWRPVHVRSIAAIGNPYLRNTKWTRPGLLISSGPFVLKDHIKSAKHLWHDACFVPKGAGREQFESIAEALWKEQGKSFNRGFVVKQYVPLRSRGTSAREYPQCEEYRLFFWRGKLLVASHYHNQTANRQDWSQFEKLAERFEAPFFTMDIAETEIGSWLIMDMGAGECSSLPPSLPASQFYSRLLEVLEGTA